VTSPPTRESCDVGNAGVFGNASDEDTQIVVDFGYELEVSSGDIDSEILPALESSFSNSILPQFFPEACPVANSGRRRQRRRLTTTTTAVSSRPNDVVLTDVKCSTQHDQSNQCVVVEGEMTIYLQGDTGDQEERLLTVIKDGMENGDFTGAHEGVVRVSYVEIGTGTTPGAGTEPTVTPAVSIADQGGRSNAPLIYGLVGVGTVLLVGMAAILWRKRGDRDQNSNHEHTNLM